jgi:hypothetical protein
MHGKAGAGWTQENPVLHRANRRGPLDPAARENLSRLRVKKK